MSRMTDFCDVCCDECGCWEQSTVTTLTEARRLLKRKGWSVYTEGGKVLDKCPSCNGSNKDYWGIPNAI